MPRLSPRQEEIVVLVVAHRLTYREVADALGIAHSTVENHVAEIARRLDGLGDTPQKAMAAYYRTVGAEVA